MDKKVYKDYEGSIKFENVEKLTMDKPDVGTTTLVVAIPVLKIVMLLQILT